MQIVATDIVGPLPESDGGNSYVLVVADYFTRWIEAFPLPNQEATTVANKLVDEVFLRLGIPEQLHSDQGRQFESKLLSEVCKLLQIHKTRTTPYHPQCDGLVERFNRTLLNMLSTYAVDHPFDWEPYLRKMCMAYSSSIQASTGYTPFYLMFGREARLPLDIMYGTNQTTPLPSAGEYATQLQSRLLFAYNLVRKHTGLQHQRQKVFYDKKVHGKPYKPGDLVWLHSPVPPRGASWKLYHPWTGPFKVVKKLSEVTYRIQQVQRKRIRKVVHFDHLKPCSANVNVPENEYTDPQAVRETDLPTSQPLNQDTSPAAAPHTYGSELELVDYDDYEDVDNTSASVPVHITEQPAVHRYPSREHRPPQRYDSYVRH